MLYPTLWRSRTPNIWNDLFTIRNEFDRLLERTEGADLTSAWSPVVDIREEKDALVLNAELPGLKSEDVSASVESGVLTISGEKKRVTEEGDENASYHVVERSYGRFERSFRLPQSVDSAKVQAAFENGVLTVTLPKAEEAKPRRLDIVVKNRK